jgi:hypothetical protein
MLPSQSQPTIKERTRHIPIKIQNRLAHVSTEQARDIIQELWYQYADRLLNRVAEVCDLNEEQTDALRRRELRPNDFRIVIT